MAQSNDEPTVSLSVKPPEPFTFNPQEWTSWKKRFERYRSISQLSKATGKQQVDMLVYCMGEKGEKILESFNLNESDQSDYDKVLEKFEHYYIPKKNLIFERARFLKCKQGITESIEDFLTTLHNLARNCEWGQIEEQMVLMVLIIGMRDESLSDRLQLETDLKLEHAVNVIRKSEELVRQKQELNSSEVDSVRTLGSFPSRTKVNHSHNALNTKYNPNLSNKYSLRDCNPCFWCGKSPPHPRHICPARNSSCSNCNKTGHFSKVCRSNKVHQVQSNEYNIPEENSKSVDSSLSSHQQSYISSVNSNSLHSTEPSNDPWVVTLNLNDSDDVTFKIDTGADVTVLPSDVKLSRKLRLRPSFKTLKGANGCDLSVLGTATVKISYKNLSCYEKVYVSKGTSMPLLGKPAIEKLNLVSRINEVSLNANTWYAKHPNLFNGLGSVSETEYKIELKDNVTPYAINTPRRIPLPLWEATKKELQNMKSMGVISEVHHATDWCAPMVIVPKKTTNKVRICVDLSKLNKCVKRRYYPIQPVDVTLAQISGATVYSKLDANNGFWQINLDRQSQDLTTFLTPFGRFKFLKLPFGISSAPEIFQEVVNRTLDGQKNAVAHMDDIIVWGKTKQEHDSVLETVLCKLENAGFTLNKDKCQFSQKSVIFLGHHLSGDGIRIDESKVEAIRKLAPPTDITGVQRFLGMVNFVGKYVPNKSSILKPITDLLSSKNEWHWGRPQQIAFEKIKNLLASPPQLAFYDVNLPTMVSADSSQLGLGGVILQQQKDNVWRPLSYISRTLSESEKNYSNIEREALAITWSCDKFKDYIIGKNITIETDHKPLLSILTIKDLNDLTPRLQRLRIRLMRYSYRVIYTPGKHLSTADCLSRSPITATEKYDLEEEIEYSVSSVIENLQTTDAIIQKIALAQQSCPIFKKIHEYSSSEWPEKSKIPNKLKPYYPVRHEISFCDGLLLRGDRMIIPDTLRPEMLNKIHSGHFGINKCRLRASYSMWWPGINADIEKTVNDCPKCTEFKSQHQEPLIPGELPSRPWEKASIDLFKLDGTWFVVITDCFSRYFEMASLQTLSTSEIIEKCKSVFSRHGIPYELRSDCGTQFASQKTCLENAEFKRFSQSYNFKLITSSPGFHQSNGSAEAAVKIAKSVLRKNKEDPYLAMLSYRNTPLTTTGLSPAQLLFNRTLRDNLPILPKKLDERPDLSQLRKKEEKYRALYKKQYDSHHGTRNLPPLNVGQEVWVKDLKRPGEIIRLGKEPRSYWVKTEQSTVRRNRFHLFPYRKPTNPQPKTIPVPLNFQCINSPSQPNPSSVQTRSPPQSRPRSFVNSNRQTEHFGGAQDHAVKNIPSPYQDAASGFRTRSGRLIKPVKRYEGN